MKSLRIPFSTVHQIEAVFFEIPNISYGGNHRAPSPDPSPRGPSIRASPSNLRRFAPWFGLRPIQTPQLLKRGCAPGDWQISFGGKLMTPHLWTICEPHEGFLCRDRPASFSAWVTALWTYTCPGQTNDTLYLLFQIVISSLSYVYVIDPFPGINSSISKYMLTWSYLALRLFSRNRIPETYSLNVCFETKQQGYFIRTRYAINISVRNNHFSYLGCNPFLSQIMKTVFCSIFILVWIIGVLRNGVVKKT